MAEIRNKWTGTIYTYHDSRQVFVLGLGWRVEFLISPGPNRFWMWVPGENFEPIPSPPSAMTVEIESDPSTGVSSQGHIEKRECGHTFGQGDRYSCSEGARWVVGCMRHDNPVFSCITHLLSTILKKAKEQPSETLYVRVIDPQDYYREY